MKTGDELVTVSKDELLIMLLLAACRMDRASFLSQFDGIRQKVSDDFLDNLIAVLNTLTLWRNNDVLVTAKSIEVHVKIPMCDICNDKATVDRPCYRCLRGFVSSENPKTADAPQKGSGQ